MWNSRIGACWPRAIEAAQFGRRCMGKWVAAGILDGALQAIAAADAMIAVEGQPLDFVSAMSGKLAATAMTAGDFNLVDGVAGGRRLLIPA